MQRRSFIRNSSLISSSLFVSPSEFFKTLFPDPWKVSMIRNDVGIFTERGGTIAFLNSKDGNVIVDSQFPEQAEHLINEIKKLNEKPFLKLINTHHHFDHTSGNIKFKDLVKHVVAHENCLKNQKAAAEKNKNEDKQLYPNQTYSDTWCESFGKEKICLYYFGAGHTNGDSLVHFEHANIVHTGDLVFNRRYPYIDRSAGANIKSWISVLDKTLEKFDKKTIFVFGHAFDPEKIKGDKEDIKKFKDYLEKLLQFTEQEIKAGKAKEEFLKNTSIPGVTEWQGDGIQRSLTAAYEELTEMK